MVFGQADLHFKAPFPRIGFGNINQECKRKSININRFTGIVFEAIHKIVSIYEEVQLAKALPRTLSLFSL